jgi:hypothetical protein
VSARLIGLRRSLMQWTDKRVGLMNEIINSMQMIKFMAWERPFKVGMAPPWLVKRALPSNAPNLEYVEQCCCMSDGHG